MSLEPGTQIGRFRIVRLIAQGGMAEVYRAEQELAGAITRPTALKVIRPEYSGSQDFREMFLDEARLACTLSHPNIVHIYEVGEAQGRLFMAMELVSGESLAGVSRKLRERQARFGDDALVAIGIFTCSALEAVHALRLPGQGHVNLVHRDVSPHNLLLGASGALKLIDFGIAKATTNRNLTSAGVTKGKAGYFSPEQAMGLPLDGRSDLFSLGVTLYKLAWGGTPFDQHRSHQERNAALVHGRWEPLRAVCPGLPQGFYDIVDCALQVKPEDRFEDAARMRGALESLAVESGFHVGPSALAGYVQPLDEEAPRTPPPPPPRPRTERLAQRAPSPSVPVLEVQRTRRRLFLVSGSAAVLLATVVGLILGGQLARQQTGSPVPLPQAVGAQGATERPAQPALPAPALRPPSEVPPSDLSPSDLSSSARRPPSAEPEAPAASARPQSALPPSELQPPSAESEAPAVAARPERRPSLTQRRREVRAAEAREVKAGAGAEAAPRAEVEAEADPERPAAKLAQGPGSLRVGGNEDARVEVNGKRSPPPPFNLSLPAGSYLVRVRSLDGTRQLSRRVEVRPDHASKFIYDLERSTVTVGD